jgi:PAS domain S-box-containing protein
MRMSLYERIFDSIPDAVLVVGGNGLVREANRQAHTMFAYPPPALVGLTIESLIPARLRGGHAGHRHAYLESPRLRPMGAGLELRAERSDGVEFPVDVMISPMGAGTDAVVLCVLRDVTARVAAEARLRDSLQEKDTLLREIHHRVKNNLAVISSLLYLQATRTDDQDVRNVLHDSQRRVRSMALVHETLYQSESLAAVDFDRYADELCRQVLASHVHPDQKVVVESRLPPLRMPVDTAVPCALILNELLTNALKHAFPSGRTGTITLEADLTSCPEALGLCVRDDGIGSVVPEGAPQSLGLLLVQSLARQLDGTFSVETSAHGTTACLRIPRRHATA